MLTGGKDDRVSLQRMGRTLFLFGNGAAAFILVVSLDPAELHTLDMAVSEYPVKGPGREHAHALLLCLFDLFQVGGELFPFLAEGQGYLLRAEAHGGSGAVKGHVAGSHDDHAAAHAGILSHGGPAQEVRAEQYAGQFISGHFQAVSLMRADGDEHRVIRAQQLGGFRHPAIAFDLYADLGDIRRLFGDHLARQAVGGDAVGHLPAQRRIRFLERNTVALLGQIEGRGHAGGAAAHDADLFPRVGKALLVVLPERVVRMLGGIALDVADRNRLVDLPAAALALTGMGTDPAETLRERNTLVNHGGRLVIAAFLHQAHIARHICVRRALRRAGDQGIPFFDGVPVERVADGPRGTDLGAGAAEAAVGILEQFVVKRSDIGLQILLVVLQHADLAEVLAGTHAASAEDAAVHVVYEERVALVHLQALDAAGHAGRGDTHILDQGLQLAFAVFRAGRAVLGMCRQQQLHREVPQAGDLFGPGTDHHSVGRLQLAGRMDALLSFHLDEAETAGAQVGQVRMMTEMRNVDAVLKRRLEEVHPFLDPELPAVNGNGYSHMQNPCFPLISRRQSRRKSFSRCRF